MSTLKPPDKLRDDLRSAVAAELTTLPAYLYAYWTIKPAQFGGSVAAERARTVIMSVILEEMLHMAQSSNILNALGGTPDFTSAPFLPVYPCRLLRSPHAQPALPPPHENPKGWGVEVFLRRLSIGKGSSITNFMAIELPKWFDPKAATLGEFYDGIIVPELPRDPARWTLERQFPTWNNPGAGKLFAVGSYEAALRGITTIVDQGEGTKMGEHDDGDHELAHFWKFKEVHDMIAQGLINLDQDVYPVIDSPGAYAANYTAAQKQANLAFNSTYSELLDSITATLQTGTPEVFPKSTRLMEMLGQQAAVLRQQGNVPGTQQLAGPTFEYVPAPQRTGAKGA
jgi:hypothetical protein